MAQYFEVLSQNDGSEDQSQHQFFNGNLENERPQVRYILAEDSAQFQTQQLIFSADQVMVLDNSQQQIQGVVIDQGHTYQTTSQPQQFGAMNNQQPQQIFYMETNSNQGGEAVQQPVQAVIEPATIQNSPQSQPIVLNHQIGSPRQLLQGSPVQRPILQIRTPARQGHVPPRLMKQGLPQQVRPHLPPTPTRSLAPPQVQMRLKSNVSHLRPSVVPQLQQQTSPPRLPSLNPMHQKSQLSSLNRQLTALQQQKEQLQQQQQVQQQSPPAVQQPPPQQQIMQQQMVPQQQQQRPHPVLQQQQASGQVIPSQIQKGLNEFQQQQIKTTQEEELDDHDPTMNSSPGQMANYKKMLEQRQQIGKNPILARLPSNIKITSTSSTHQQLTQTQPQQCTINQAIDQVVNQSQSQQPDNVPQQQQANLVPLNMVQSPPKKSRAPPRPKNVNGAPRQPAGGRQRASQRMPMAQTPYSGPRGPGPQQPPSVPRFSLNQQQPRFTATNQQQIMQQQQQRLPLQQPIAHPPTPQQHAPAPPAGMQNAQPPMNHTTPQSQMNYLITPPTPNRPRQQHPLPSYIPSSQIQQIIGMFQENTPIAEEFSDSIRMLVLLENGEQRLITFTLPKEACTIQEILEQVNVPFTPETNIQVTEANTNGINYIVTVGNVSNFGYVNNEEEPQDTSSDPEQQQLQQMQQNGGNIPPFAQKPPPSEPVAQSLPPQPELPKPPSPEPPKLIPGKLAVCPYCGITGEDFNRCTRCHRKLSKIVKMIDAPLKKEDIHKPTPPELLKQLPAAALLGPALVKSVNAAVASSNSSALAKQEPAAKPPSPTKKKSKAKPVEHESVVISSDEEEDEKPVRSVRVSEQLLNKLGASISISPVTKEPSLTEIKKHVRKLSVEPTKLVKLPLRCRTVRIGSYRFAPGDDVILDSRCMMIKAPVMDNKAEMKTIRIDRGDIIKVLICYNKGLPVIFYYLNVDAALIICDMLNLTRESGLYFDPIDEKEDSYRKITLLPEDIIDEHRDMFQLLYGIAPNNIMDELTTKEANDILIKACPKDSTSSSVGSFSEIKQILMYPKEGQGRLSINTEDYVCLAVDQFLNDKIIDFYLKYLWENLPPTQQEKVHIFSTFFYKRLTTKPTRAAKKSHPFESDTTLTAAEKRHCRVKNWTKKINIFEKDFIIVPINESAHWYLAIICFPGMQGPQTFDGKPYHHESRPKKATKSKQVAAVKKEKPIPCDDPMLSDKDEADSEDSDMESDDQEEAAAVAAAAAAAALAAQVPKSRGSPKIPIKQPCILIFDSLAGPSRSRVVATLRDYLTYEFKAKMDFERVYSRDVIKGASCKVPQQTNFTDCGLYLLQYVEQFFKEPLKDYNIPIKGIADWFEEIVVTRKREDICNLLKELMIESGSDIKMLPDIALPTLNGKLIDRPEPNLDHDTGEEEQEDMFTDIEDSEMTDANISNASRISEENGSCKSEECQENSSGGENSSQGSFLSSPLKPSDRSVEEKSEIVASVVEASGLKPTLTEFPRQTTNKDTLNYLKAKRIIRHKHSSEGPEFKKSRFEN